MPSALSISWLCAAAVMFGNVAATLSADNVPGEF